MQMMMLMQVMYVLQKKHGIQMKLMEKCVGGVDNVGETDAGDDDDDGLDVDVDLEKMVQKMVWKMQVM